MVALVTFPVRAALRAAWAILETEPLATFILGPDDAPADWPSTRPAAPCPDAGRFR